MYKRGVAATVLFKAIDSNDGVSGKTGLTFTTKNIIKDGAAPTPLASAPTECGGGWYLASLTNTEFTAESIGLDFQASGAVIAPIVIHTEADYTAARAANMDAAVSSRSVAGDAMALTSGERTTLAAAIWNALTSGMTTVGSIGKKLADWVIGTTQTGDSYAIVNSGTYGNAALKTAVDSITVATNAGDLATKQADSATLTTGTTISGTYASTATNDAVYWITAPVTPAVGGFGLRQQLVFDLPLGRTPVGIQVRGYFNGSSATVDVYALNSRTGVYDKLTNSSTNLASRNSDSLYSIPLPRDYAEDSGGSYNIVTLEFRSASTNTAHRLRLDQVLIAHVAEDVAVTSTAPTVQQIWGYTTRELTTPGAEPVTVPTAADIRTELDANSTKLAHLDADISSRLASGSYSAPPSAATNASAVRTELATELGRIDAAVSTRSTYAGADTAGTTTLLSRVTAAPLLASNYTAPDNAGIAAIGGIVTGIAGDVTDVLADTDELQTEWADGGRLDLILDSAASGGSTPSASDIADEVQTRTLDANIKKVNGIAISGTGAPGDTWGP